MIAASHAEAAIITPVQPPSPDEETQAQILAHVYGGTFNLTGGVNYTNGSITAQRVDDEFDRFFNSGPYDAQAHAIFAWRSQTFGYLPGESGGSFQTLIAVTGSEYNVQGTAEDIDLDGIIRFARRDNDYLVTTKPSDNSDGLDHVVTYQIEGLDTDQTVLMLFFEDLPASDSFADFDYNDLVIELRFLGEVDVPEPASIALMAAPAFLLLARRTRCGNA
ncbi:MAG: DUF4114 domain-containing protein [Phycisphaeraceae bacterium]|nr:DUF4114 domain-containing protein [Phycisphaeraceae bacterium]